MYTQKRMIVQFRFFFCLYRMAIQAFGATLPQWIVNALMADSQWLTDNYLSLMSFGNASEGEAFSACLEDYLNA